MDMHDPLNPPRPDGTGGQQQPQAYPSGDEPTVAPTWSNEPTIGMPPVTYGRGAAPSSLAAHDSDPTAGVWRDEPPTPYAPPGTNWPHQWDAATPPQPPYAGYSGYGTGYPGGTPPNGGPRRGRGALRGLLLLVALLLAVGVGFGAGVGYTRSRGGSAANIVIGNSSSPSIKVSATTATVQQDLEAVAKAVEPSVVKVTSMSASAEAVGSGDILNTSGYIVTNDHVVQGFSSFTVTLSNGSNYTATVVGQDAQDDLAVIKISAPNLTPIAIADSSKIQVGEFAVAVGNPLALQESTTLGTVSGVNGTASEAPDGPAGTLTGMVQTTAPINPGNSGGALVNLQGQLIGIPTLEVTDPQSGKAQTNVGYAIPSSRVTYVTQQLIAHGSLANTNQGYLGIQSEDVTPRIASSYGLSVQSGVLVAGFVQDTSGKSPAQSAGLQTNDVITAVDGQTVSNGGDLAGMIMSRAPGTPVKLTVQRGGSQLTITVTLGERPTSTQG